MYQPVLWPVKLKLEPDLRLHGSGTLVRGNGAKTRLVRSDPVWQQFAARIERQIERRDRSRRALQRQGRVSVRHPRFGLMSHTSTCLAGIWLVNVRRLPADVLRIVCLRRISLMANSPSHATFRFTVNDLAAFP